VGQVVNLRAGRRPALSLRRLPIGAQDAILPHLEQYYVNSMWERISEIIRKELIQSLREPRMRFMLFLPPLIQLLIFGFAVNLDLEHTKIAWMDLDHTPESRDLGAAFAASRYFEVAALLDHEEQVQYLMDRSKVQAVIRVLPGFARDIERGKTAAVQVLVEGTNSNTASLVSNYANLVVAGYAAQVRDEQQRQQVLARSPTGPPSGGAPQVNARTRVWFNPDLRSRNYFIPGVVANIIMTVTMMLTALGIVREKEIGTMEQLMVTPIRPIELIIGKMIPFAMMGLIDLVLVTTAAIVVFNIPFRGSALLLLACSILFLMTSLGAGLFISTVSHTQQQAMMSSFFFTMPAFMLSGFTFPIRNMPPSIRAIAYMNPVYYFMEIVRGIFLKGAGLQAVFPQMVFLAVFGAAILGLSAWRFQKRLD
jgi:ABC-2 type transport system permease protein